MPGSDDRVDPQQVIAEPCLRERAGLPRAEISALTGWSPDPLKRSEPGTLSVASDGLSRKGWLSFGKFQRPAEDLMRSAGHVNRPSSADCV